MTPPHSELNYFLFLKAFYNFLRYTNNLINGLYGASQNHYILGHSPHFQQIFGEFQMNGKDLDQKIQFLSKVPPFDDLPSRALSAIGKDFVCRKYKNKELILHQGDATCNLCVLVKGKIKVLTTNEAGNESCLRILGEKDIFGELSAYDTAPRSASAQALKACMILSMDHNHFINHLKNVPNLSFAFIRFLSEKLRWTTHFAHTLAQYDTAGRLLYLITYYKDVFGEEIIADKVYEIDLALNQTDLATMVGARREWVNRLMRKWSKKGFLHYSRGKITICDLPELLAEKNRRMAIFREESW